MNEKTVKSGNVVVNKKEFHASKKPIAIFLLRDWIKTIKKDVLRD